MTSAALTKKKKLLLPYFRPKILQCWGCSSSRGLPSPYFCPKFCSCKVAVLRAGFLYRTSARKFCSCKVAVLRVDFPYRARAPIFCLIKESGHFGAPPFQYILLVKGKWPLRCAPFSRALVLKLFDHFPLQLCHRSIHHCKTISLHHLYCPQTLCK